MTTTDAAPHVTAGATPEVRDLCRVFPPFSPLRERVRQYHRDLCDHTPAAPAYVTWNLARFVRTIEFLAPVVGGQTRWLEIGSDPWFCLLAHLHLGRAPAAPTGYTDADITFEKGGTPGYRFTSEVVRVGGTNGDLGRFREYDLVSAFEVFEHLPEHPATFLAAVNAALRPGGRLILSTPNIASWSSIGRLLDGATPHMTPLYGGPMEHRKEYTCWEVAALLAAAGFKVERLRTFDVYTNDFGGWRSTALWAGNVAWHAATLQPRRCRNLLSRSGSTMFLDAVKVGECDVSRVAEVRV